MRPAIHRACGAKSLTLDTPTRVLGVACSTPSMSPHGGQLGDESTEAEAPNAEDLTLALVRKNVLARMFGQSSVPLHISRYEVLRKLGEGGMGQVYLCRDEQLGREVAVKLVHSRRAGMPAQTRLLREARGLARLSHPNVVQIYEVGEHEGGLFLAMEFIPGRTLRAHLRANLGLDWRARLELILQAGRGLAAAHASGLVHRDIKPDNILVGDDGRVRVLDFGLARGLDAEGALHSNTEDGVSESEPLLDTLTAAGSLLGTPAYMAPEQHEGLACDALSDQFSFCVVAHEVLFDERPFRGSTFGELREAVLHGRRSDVPASASDVPRKARAAIVRGLAVAPSDRWPDMDALLSVLVDALGVRRRRLMVMGAIGLLGLGGSSALLLDPTPEPATRPCQIGVEALDGTWDDSRRATLRAGHAATGLADAEVGVAVIERSLDAWAQRWVDVQTQVCEATHVTGVQSQDMLDRRGACLSRVRREGGAVIAVLSHGDAQTIARSAELLAALPDAELCLSDDIVELHESLATDPQARERIEAAYADVAAAGALARAGRLDEADARVEQLRERLAGNTYAPLDVELTALSGRALLWHHKYAEGLPMLIDAARAAEGLRLDDRVSSLRMEAARAAAGRWGDPERERWLVDEAEAALTRLGRVDDLRHVDLQLARADLLTDSGDHEAALAARRAATEQARNVGAEDLAENARRLVGQSLTILARFDEARVEFEIACEAIERRWGAHAGLSADCEFDLGVLEVQAGRSERATLHLARARQSYAELFGPSSPEVARIDNSRATLAMLGGDLKAAEQLLDEVIAAREREPERWPELLADTHELRGAVLFYRGDHRGSIQAYERALELRRAVLGVHHPLLGNLHANIGEAQVALGEHDAARASFALALASLEQSLPNDHPSLALPYKGRGQSSLALGDYQAALEDLERAHALQSNGPGEPLELADIEFSLARALSEVGQVSRARELATKARDRYRAVDQSELARKIDIWLEQKQQHD
jgi:tetratricopeptide (TPR) repeat protein/predicted Ser/Thr protein kinase